MTHHPEEAVTVGVPDIDDMFYTYGLHRVAQHEYVRDAKHLPDTDDPVYMRLVANTESVRKAAKLHIESLVSLAREEERKKILDMVEKRASSYQRVAKNSFSTEELTCRRIAELIREIPYLSPPKEV